MGRAIDGVKGREWEERLRRYPDSQLTVGEFCWRLVCQAKAGGHDLDFEHEHEHEHEHRFTEHEHDEKQDHSPPVTGRSRQKGPGQLLACRQFEPGSVTLPQQRQLTSKSD